MNVLKKSGTPSDDAVAKLIGVGQPLMACKIRLCKSADGLIRANRPKAAPNSKSQMKVEAAVV